MKRVTAFAVLALVAMPAGAPGAARPDDITAVTVAAVQRWVSAVENHVPGQRDAEVERVSALTYDKRRDLSVGIGFFLSVLRGKPEVIKNPAETRIAQIAGAIRVTPGTDAFLRRAAVLHADVAIDRDREGIRPAEPARRAGFVPRGAAAALLSGGSLYINQDGEILGETPMDWNWPFARSLLDLILASQPDDPFVASWYHTTAAFMLQRGQYGEAVPHLERAVAVLPDDAKILFDRACYAEIMGLPRNQVLLSDRDLMASRAARAGGMGLIKIPSASERQFGIPPENETNDEAERWFRRALRSDPSYVEARVRLGRLLGVRKRHDEAAAELAAALAAKPTGSVLFYAHLFAGRSAQAMGKIADAAAHYKAADLLFPGAQSSGLAASQAALLESDVPAAVDSIHHIDKSTMARDPWRWYHHGAGRDADALLQEMWRQVVK
jgi:tetratricopeptide (TPR) repeat protein